MKVARKVVWLLSLGWTMFVAMCFGKRLADSNSMLLDLTISAEGIMELLVGLAAAVALDNLFNFDSFDERGRD